MYLNRASGDDEEACCRISEDIGNAKGGAAPCSGPSILNQNRSLNKIKIPKINPKQSR